MRSVNCNTTMREAFLKAKAPLPKFKSPLLTSCLFALRNGAGIVRRREWNARLSFRTAEQLKKQGVLVG